MANLYDSMTQALRTHWKANDNAYPQKFVLTEPALKTLNDLRTLVNTTMANKFRQGWETDFLGVKIEIGNTNHMVGADGSTVPLES